MKILLIAVVTVSVVVCYGNAGEYNTEFEAHRAANVQKLFNEALKPSSTQKHNRAPYSSSQSTRNEYRRFGTDAITLDSHGDVSALSQNHKTNGGAMLQTRNTEFQDSSSFNKNQVNNFPYASGTSVQKSSFEQQELRSDVPHTLNPVPQIQAFSSLEMSRPSDVDVRPSSINLHNQEVLQKSTPILLDHRDETQTGVYNIQNMRRPSAGGRTSTTTLLSQQGGQKGTPFAAIQDHTSRDQRVGLQSYGGYEVNRDSLKDQPSQNKRINLNQNGKNIFESQSDAVQDQISQNQRIRFLNQGNFKPSDVSIEDQNRGVPSQNEMRHQNGFNQNKNYLTQSRHFSQSQVKSSQDPAQYQHFPQQEQIKSPQEPLNQYQYHSQEGQIKSSPEQRNQYQHQQHQQTSLPVLASTKDSFDQVPDDFESRRILGNRQPEDQNKYALPFVSYPSNQQIANRQNNEDVRVASDFKDDYSKQDRIWNTKHDVEMRTEGIVQGPFQTLSGQKTIFAVPQFRQGHTKSILVSGSKGGPVVLHNTSNVASSHAVVIGKDSGALGKGAYLTQHLKTPYAHYTYSHNL